MITVLITGCSMHSYDLITELRRNYENEDIKVVGINCAEDALLRKGVDAGYIVPRITEPDYIPTVLDICKKENVDVILPFITAELPIMADNKKFFEDEGIKVSVTSKSSLEFVGEKTSLYGLFGSSMPKQSIVHTIADDIYRHSENQTISNIMFVLANHAVITCYEIDGDDNR